MSNQNSIKYVIGSRSDMKDISQAISVFGGGSSSNIPTLTSTNATITNATVSTLTSTNATVSTLTSTNATITTLTVTNPINADIKMTTSGGNKAVLNYYEEVLPFFLEVSGPWISQNAEFRIRRIGKIVTLSSVVDLSFTSTSSNFITSTALTNRFWPINNINFIISIINSGIQAGTLTISSIGVLTFSTTALGAFTNGVAVGFNTFSVQYPTA